MAELRTEDEQVEAIKQWWRNNGTSTLLAIVVALVVYFAWNYWQNQQQTHSAEASRVYDQLMVHAARIEGGDFSSVVQAQALAKQLSADFSNSSYGDFGRLFTARFAVEAGDYAQAEAELSELHQHAHSQPIQYTAQVRLAQVYVQQEKFDEALALVSQVPDEAFAAQFAEVQGDVYFRQNNIEQAIVAYQQALNAARTLGVSTELLQRKIDSLSTHGEL